MSQKYASWASKDTRESSNLPSDFDGAIVAAKFTKEAPDNYEASGNPIFAVVSILQDGEAPENERTIMQSYSLGAKAGDEFTVSNDGYGLIPSGEETAIRKGSKFDLFKCSLENEGVPQTLTEQGDLSKFFGLRGHWKRIDDAKLLGKEREFMDDKRKKSKFPPQTLVCVKLLALPGEKAAGKPNGAATQVQTGNAASPTNDSGADLDTLTAGYLKTVLANAKDGKVQRSQLTLLLSKAAMASGRRQDIGRRGADEEFLKKLAEEGIMLGDDIFSVAYDPAAKPQFVSAG